MDSSIGTIEQKVISAERLWLFLDYDGTLAEFAPTPDHIEPNPEIIRLVQGLSENPLIRVSIISGRRLKHVEELVPVDGIWLVGTYGIEFLQPDGVEGFQIPYQKIRPTLESMKPKLETLLSEREGFYLEDKGWALAIHARFAKDSEADEVLDTARKIMETYGESARFRILDGHKFLEVGPRAGNKGITVNWLLHQFPFPDSLPVYLGDDDKDEEAFSIIHQSGGLAVVVASEPRQTLADARLPSPQAALDWLRLLLEKFNQRAGLSATQEC